MHSLNSGYRKFTKKWWQHHLDPRTYFYWMKYKIQRANRGWADCDTWSLDNYLSEWLPDAIRHLKKHSHGYPASLHNDTEINTSQAASDTAEAKWDSILEQITLGFDAYNRVTDGLYEAELGEYPLDKPASDERFKKSRELEKRDMQTFHEGMKLFVEHFQSLSD